MKILLILVDDHLSIGGDDKSFIYDENILALLVGAVWLSHAQTLMKGL